MATNEDLAVAFLCLCDSKDREELLQMIDDTLSRWDDIANKERIREAIRLPHSLIQRKIALLHTGLYICPQKKKIYEEMANRLANMTATLRSPLLRPVVERPSLGIYDSADHLMPVSLYSNETAEK
jgi:uncharacterized protein Yka (UPF0111/DUF47 family)